MMTAPANDAVMLPKVTKAPLADCSINGRINSFQTILLLLWLLCVQRLRVSLWNHIRKRTTNGKSENKQTTDGIINNIPSRVVQKKSFGDASHDHTQVHRYNSLLSCCASVVLQCCSSSLTFFGFFLLWDVFISAWICSFEDNGLLWLSLLTMLGPLFKSCLLKFSFSTIVLFKNSFFKTFLWYL